MLLNFKSNSISAFDVDINDLYNNKYQLVIHIKQTDNTLYVILKDLFDKIDCKISSPSLNIWFRTKSGCDRKRYNSIRDLQREIKKAIIKYLNIDDNVEFSLTDNINFI